MTNQVINHAFVSIYNIFICRWKISNAIGQMFKLFFFFKVSCKNSVIAFGFKLVSFSMYLLLWAVIEERKTRHTKIEADDFPLFFKKKILPIQYSNRRKKHTTSSNQYTLKTTYFISSGEQGESRGRQFSTFPTGFLPPPA